ncbi:HTTM domain-containing protein [Nonlabens mediterrranea]|uniref:HTTM domain-containing protein n=2 Tax=Nonlabens mediterrranea TaxID=1419947 RepID=A0ABS0A3T8_9FLAO|nr:HTTM domain-containing protein [Nonlabens mediterrranea]
MFTKLIARLNSKIIPFDPRSLGIFRIILGLAIIYNIVFYRFPAVGVFYNTPDLIPPSTITNYYGVPLPLFNWIDSDVWYNSLFLIMLLLSVLLTVGYRLKWVIPALFVLFGSMITTNPYVAHGVEYLEETALFWAIFLPLDRRFSLTKITDVRSQNSGNFAHLGFHFQLFLIYFSSWIFKNGELWKSGKILEIVSKDLIHSKPLLQGISNQPEFLELLTYSGFYLEVIVSLLILSAFFFENLRKWIFISLFFLHVTMALYLHVGTFFIIGLAFSVVFLPAGFWNHRLLNKLYSPNSIIDSTQKVKLNQLKIIGLLVFMAFILHGNLHHWSKNSYLSSALSSLPFFDCTIGRQLSDPGIFTGFWHQSWKFFPNNIYDDLGDFIFIGYNASGEAIELRTDTVLTISENDDAIDINPLPSHSYSGAEFTFGVYYKFYQNRFPKSTQQGWLNIELDNYKKAHPKKEISKAELWRLQRFHYYEGDHLILQDSLTKVMTIYNPIK